MENDKKSNKKIKVIIFALVAIIIVGIVIAFVIYSNNKSNDNNSTEPIEEVIESTTLTETSSNYMGRRFTFDVAKFEEIYIEVLKNNFTEYQELLDKKLIDTNFVLSDEEVMDSYAYEFNQKCYDETSQITKYFSITLEQESQSSSYINLITINALALTSQDILTLSENNIIYAFMAIDNSLSYDDAQSILTDLYQAENKYISNGEVTYAIDTSDSEWYVINIFPLNEEQYSSFLKQQGLTEDDTELTDEETLLEVQRMLNYVAYDFEPTDEQLYQILKYYKSVENCTEEMILEFITQEGYLETNTETDTPTQDSSSQTQSNSTSSTTTTNTTTTSSSNQTTKQYPVITLDIDLKQLMANNETAQEILDTARTIFIHVYVEDTFEGTTLFQYYSGGSSVPSSISAEMTLLEGEKVSYFSEEDSTYKYRTTKDRTEKRTVKITMDNTATQILETTLYEGEMVFSESGTYEIK